jgi:hypothetical protein
MLNNEPIFYFKELYEYFYNLRTIVNICKDESQKENEDPALKTITTLFKSLLSSDNDSSANPVTKNIAPSIISMFQPMQP